MVDLFRRKGHAGHETPCFGKIAEFPDFTQRVAVWHGTPASGPKGGQLRRSCRVIQQICHVSFLLSVFGLRPAERAIRGQHFDFFLHRSGLCLQILRDGFGKARIGDPVQ